MNRVLLISLLALMPVVAHAATADLAISPDDISISGDLISGNKVRVYAEVTNVGDMDVAGYVSFYQGSLPIGDSQVISVRAGGLPEEVYVDFTIPSGPFNVRADIRGTDPEDENAGNDSAMTKLYTPIADDDRDGVANDSDNCPSDANASQKDSDSDGAGDACDDDDDEDGLTDEVEEELGTSSTSSDSDGDGVADSKDAYPTDESKSVVPPPAPAPVVKPTPTPSPESVEPSTSASTPPNLPLPRGGNSVDDQQPTTDNPPPTSPEPTTNDSPQTTNASASPTLSPAAIFSGRRVSWNTFSFASVVPETAGYQYRWDFGDGVTSSKPTVEHTFAGSGEYDVRFRVTDPSGQTAEDALVVRVPFWSLHNRPVDILLAFLTALLLAGIAVVIRLSKRPLSKSLSVSDEDVAEDAGATRVRVRDLNED